MSPMPQPHTDYTEDSEFGQGTAWPLVVYSYILRPTYSIFQISEVNKFDRSSFYQASRTWKYNPSTFCLFRFETLLLDVGLTMRPQALRINQRGRISEEAKHESILLQKGKQIQKQGLDQNRPWIDPGMGKALCRCRKYHWVWEIFIEYHLGLQRKVGLSRGGYGCGTGIVTGCLSTQTLC